MSQRNWKSKSNLGDVWNPKQDENNNPRFKASDDDYIEGTYVDRKEGIGQYNSTVHNIETDSGELIAVWGDTVLNKELEKHKFGTYIRIKFEGRKLKKDVKEGSVITDKNSFWNWTVLYDDTQSVSEVNVNDAISAPAKANSMSNVGTSNGVDDLPF